MKVPAPQYIDGEQHLLFGVRYPLKVVQIQRGRNHLQFDGKTIMLHLRPDATFQQRQRLMHRFYSERLAVVVEVFMKNYQQTMQCPDIPFRIMRRKSVWGTYHVLTRTIIYNLLLAQVDTSLVQYVVLHEMTHQYVAAHNADFYARVAALMPDWSQRRKTLREFALQNISFR